MIFSVAKSELMEAINITSRAVSSKSSLAVLEGLLIEATDCVKLTGYDLEVGIECSVLANISQKGAVVLNARTFSDIVRKLPDDVINFECDEKYKTVITCGMSQFTILGFSVDDFPEIPKVISDKKLTVSKPILKSMIRQTLFAVSTNDTKPIHTGSLFDKDKDVLRIVSVDGYRMAIREEKLEGTDDSSFSFVVPGKTLGELLKILSDDDAPVTLNLSKKHIIVESENAVLVSRLLEGDFINYKNTVPKEAKIVFESDTRSFIDSIERASLLINERIKSPIRFMLADDKVKITCSSAIGRFVDEFSVKGTNSEIEMGFNNRFLLDALKGCEDSNVKIELTTNLSPLVVKPVEGNSYLYLVLPVRLKNEE